MERYLAAKARLFHELCDGPSVVNANQAPLHLMDALPSRPILRVGETGSAPDLDITSSQPDLKGLSLNSPCHQADLWGRGCGRAVPG